MSQMPFEEMGEEKQQYVLRNLGHSKECDYHTRDWYLSFGDFIQQEKLFEPVSIPMMKRNLNYILDNDLVY